MLHHPDLPVIPSRQFGFAVLSACKRSQFDLSPAFLLMAAAAVSFLVVLRLRETYQLTLSNPAATAAADAV